MRSHEIEEIRGNLIWCAVRLSSYQMDTDEKRFVYQLLTHKYS
jgi:hypothetical protein